jgi:hypothetical protein
MIRKIILSSFLSLAIVSVAFAQSNDAECFQKFLTDTKIQNQALDVFDRLTSDLIVNTIKVKKNQVALYSTLKDSRILEGAMDIIVNGKIATEGKGYSVENLNADPSDQVIEPSFSAVFSERMPGKCSLVFNSGDLVINNLDQGVKIRIKIDINNIINY